MLSLHLKGAVSNLNQLLARTEDGELRARLEEQQEILRREMEVLSQSLVDQALFAYFSAGTALDAAIRVAEEARAEPLSADPARTREAIRSMDDAIKEVEWFRLNFPRTLPATTHLDAWPQPGAQVP
jgi:hypothetical protein